MRNRICDNLSVVVLWACVASVTWSSESVIYVDAAASGAGDGTSWTDAYVHLQDAFTEIAETSDPVEIRVAQGTYRASDGGAGGSPRMATFELRNHLTLAGGYAGAVSSDANVRDVEHYETILTGAFTSDASLDNGAEPPTPSDSSRVILTGRGIDETVVLDGLTITRAADYGMELQPGSPTICRCRFVNNGSAGILASECNSILLDCTFERNARRGAAQGGFSLERGNLTLTGCTFVDNGATGIKVWDCNGVLTNCTFERNGYGSIWGGGFRCQQGNLRMTDCTFVENEDGGIESSGTLDLLRCSFVANTDEAAIEHRGGLTARKCVFQSNQGGIAGAVECYKTATLIDCAFTDNSARWGGAIYAAADLTLVNCQFTGNSGGFVAGAVMLEGDRLRAEGCLFAGNRCLRGAGAISNYSAPIMRLSRCTFVGNRGWYNAILHPPRPSAVAEMSQCIVWNGPEPFADFSDHDPPIPDIVVTYSNVEGGYAGEGNIDVNPNFVDLGCWDPNGTPDDPNDDVWVTGDYHLKSQAGHWDRDSESWVFDDVTSPCIDAGDPNGPLGAEPFPNGGYVNLGAYGGTAEASRSYFGGPVCETQIAGDINGDCRVDDLDMDILMSHWLTDAAEVSNIPPSITLISPEEGDEFAFATPIVFRAEASDPDGDVILVRYHFRAQWDNGSSITGATATDPTDDWKATWEWQPQVTIPPDATYTIQAEAMDDQGAKTVTPEVEIKLSL